MPSGFPHDLSVKKPLQYRSHRRRGFDPWAGKTPGEGHGDPRQYSCLENPMDRGGWQATVHRVANSCIWLKRQHTHICNAIIVICTYPSYILLLGLSIMFHWSICSYTSSTLFLRTVILLYVLISHEFLLVFLLKIILALYECVNFIIFKISFIFSCKFNWDIDYIATAAKSLQSCPTLCDPLDGSPPGSHPWDSPGKNTGVGCHLLLQCMKVKSESEVAQLCPTPGDPMDYSLPGSSVHGIFQPGVLEWGAIAFSDWSYWYTYIYTHTLRFI